MAETIGIETTKSIIRATVSRALAKALVTGIDNAAEEGHALTQLQQCDLATMAIMAYEEALEACDALKVEIVLQTLRGGR